MRPKRLAVSCLPHSSEAQGGPFPCTSLGNRWLSNGRTHLGTPHSGEHQASLLGPFLHQPCEDEDFSSSLDTASLICLFFEVLLSWVCAHVPCSFCGPPSVSGNAPAVLPPLSACFTPRFCLVIGLFGVSLASYPDKSNFRRV